MKTPKLFRRKSRHLKDDRNGPGQRGEDEGKPGLAAGLRLAVLVLQVIGAMVQLWRR